MVQWVRLHCEVIVLLSVVAAGRSESWHFTGDNIGLKKSTEQWPGTHVINSISYSSGLAVDGTRSNNFWSGSCSSTTEGTEPYWSVDLGGLYFVKGVRIYTRQDQDTQHFDNFKVLGFPTQTTLYDDAIANTKVSRTAKIDIPISPTQFSNITITLPGYRVLLLCEVEVYGVRDLNYCASQNAENKVIWSVSYGYADTEQKLVVEDSIVDFSCLPYYTLSGPDRATCLATGNYSPSNPSCLETPCQSPSTILNGAYNQIKKLEYSYYETVKWECSDGYKSDQNKTRQCLPTSEWSGTEPVCTLITCHYPSITSEVSLTLADGSSYKSGPIPSRTSVNVACDECFAANVASIICGLDEEWDNRPTCTQIECNNLGPLPGGNYTYRDKDGNILKSNYKKYACDTVAEVYCDCNYKKIVDARTCGADGYSEWSGNAVPCLAVPTNDASHDTVSVAAAGGIGGGVLVVGVGIGIAISAFIWKWRTRRRSKHPIPAQPRTPAPIGNNYDHVENIRADEHDYTELTITSNT